MTLDEAMKNVFVREQKRKQVWDEWKGAGRELPEHYTLLDEDLRKEFDNEVANR